MDNKKEIIKTRGNMMIRLTPPNNNSTTTNTITLLIRIMATSIIKRGPKRFLALTNKQMQTALWTENGTILTCRFLTMLKV